MPMQQLYTQLKKTAATFLFVLIACFTTLSATAQHSVSREWNEAMLQCIRKDLARPVVHARNIFHISASMYDAWAAFDTTASTFLLGKTVGTYTCIYNGIPAPADRIAAQEEALSFAAYRMIRGRFLNSPGAAISLPPLDTLMISLGYDPSITSTDYSTGSPAALGNYIAASYIAYGLTDGANQTGNYANQYYQPVNPPFYANHAGDSNLVDPNRWQQIFLDQYIDQNGNVYNISPPFLGAEWGNVHPFALTDSNKTVHSRDGHDYNVYLDAGPPPLLDTTDTSGITSDYKAGYLMVSIWQAQLDTADGVMWDISPGAIGNIASYPETYTAGMEFYNFIDGGDMGTGRALNPKTGLPYEPNIVHRGDYARILAEFWADGPNSETPPGHWFTILNYVGDQPQFEKRWRGTGEIISDLDWDVRSYFALSGAMHDAAIAAWSNKGWYDSPRPISILRWMCGKGQCSDSLLPNYHRAGTPLIPGYVELVMPGDPLAGVNNEHLYKIKLFSWRGHDFIPDPDVDMAGAGWILAENWWPYQRSSFVTPPFAGYMSGHSTFSRTAAELMTLMTGDPFFPGGMCEFHATQNQYLVFEEGPSEDITIQWATYQDASDQCSLSRIYGGIHPPQDDLPGRKMGMFLGPNALQHAEDIFHAGLPFVQNVTIDQDLISDQLAEGFVTISVTYNEDMDQLSQPTIEFLNAVVSPSLTSPTVNWSSARTCQISFLVSDLDTNISQVGVKVSGGLDLESNEQKAYFQNNLFDIDTRNPVLTSSSASNALVNMSLVGNGTFMVELTYDEPMNTTLTPSIVVSPTTVTSALAFNSGMSSWINDTTYQAAYDVIGNVGEPGNINFNYALGQDAAGNFQFAESSEFDVFVDTRQPLVSILSANAYVLTEQEVGLEALKFISIFDEEMDQTITPTITFPGNASAQSLLLFNQDASYWINEQTYLASFDLDFQSIDVLDIPVLVSGAVDLRGNSQVASSNAAFLDLLLDTTSVGMNDLATSFGVTSTYPNPVLSGAQLFIRIPGEVEKLQMKVYAMNGQLIRSEQINSIANGLYAVSTNNLSAGLYFVQLSDAKRTATFKVQVTD